MFNWLNQLDRHFPVRYTVWVLCAVAMLLCLFTWVAFDKGGLLALGFMALTALGLRDTRQTRHAVAILNFDNLNAGRKLAEK